MKIIRPFGLTFLIIIIIKTSLPAAPEIAFGYLANVTSNKDYQYLEIVFPNSFAKSIKNVFDVDVVKPLQINERLKEYNILLKKKYILYDLPELVEKIDSDFFIFGEFFPLPGNKIKIVLNFYRYGSNRIFKFTNISKMETQVVKLVDRITQILIDVIDKEYLYRKSVIPKGSRLAFLTNLEGQELNSLYFSFMEQGYNVCGFQGNYLYNVIDNNVIDMYKYIITKDNSFDQITDRRNIKFKYGSWAGDKYIEDITYLKKIYKLYDLNYMGLKEKALDMISASYKQSIDYFLIIGFSDNRKDAWVRCINLRTKDLIWMQSDIEGSDVQEICSEMIKNMTADLKGPFKSGLDNDQ